MKKTFVALVLALGAVGCATTVGPDGYEESFGESIGRGLVEGLFDAMFRPPQAQGSTQKKHWLAERAAHTSVSSPR